MKFLFIIVFGFALMTNADEQNHSLPDIPTDLDATILPVNFFDGTWFYWRTVIETSEKAVKTDHQSDIPPRLVEFKKAPTKLIIVDANDDIAEEDRVRSMFIPVSWKEYEMDRNMGVVREIVTREDVERPYVMLHPQHRLSKLKISQFPEVHITSEGLLITDDSFKLSIEVTTKGEAPIVINHVFKRAENSL